MAFLKLSPALRLLLLLAISSILPSTIAQQQEIECLVPHKAGDGQRPVYKTGESVQFQWKSTFPRFNLTITQVNSETGDKTNSKVYENESNDTSNYIWTASSFPGLGQDDPLHLWITAAFSSDCDNCKCRSANFTVLDEKMGSNSSDSSSSATAPAAGATSITSADDSSGDENLKLGLGIGLGLGIPLLITLTALATWMCVRRRRQQRRNSLSVGSADRAGGYDASMHTPHSSSIPLNSARTFTQPSAFGYSSDPSEKSPAPEMDSQEVMELTATDNERVEAPPDAFRAELAADDGVQRGVGYEKRI